MQHKVELGWLANDILVSLNFIQTAIAILYQK